MLSLKLEGDILEVKETIRGWHENHVTHFYYDIVTWKKSSGGREGDKLDSDCSKSAIAWIKKYYLPKVMK